MSVRSRIVSLGAVLGAGAACSESAAWQAEPPQEPVVWAESAGDEGWVMPGTIAFADGTQVGARRFAGAVVQVDVPLEVRFPVAGLVDGTSLWVGIAAPRAAGRQEVAGQSRRLVGVTKDPRDRWVEASIAAGEAVARLTVPPDWHAPQVVWLVEPRRGDQAVRARSGPRLDRGPGVLAVQSVQTQPTQVRAVRVAAGAITVDGDIDEAVWAELPGQRLHHSLDGEPDPSATAVDVQATGTAALAPGRGTMVRWAWDDEFLYVAASLPDHDLWSEFTEHDDPLYHQEVFEVFVAATGEGTRYLEYQVSARGVGFDARFPRHRAGDIPWNSRMRAAVVAFGTVNDNRDRDLGWSVELALPWTELCSETAISCPPTVGMRFRVNAFRLERPDRRTVQALALSPTRVPDFHAWANAAELELSE